MPRAPDIHFELPDGWKWQQRHQSPLGIQPESESGILQISSPSSSPNWRGEALAPLIRTFVKGAKLGKVIAIEESDCAYGRVIRAELVQSRFGDAAAWMLLHDTHDPLLVTWLAESPTDDGKIVRELVKSITPGPTSRAIDLITSFARNDIATRGELAYRAVLIGGDTITTVDLAALPDGIEVHAIRAERESLGASVVARMGMVQLGAENGVLAGSVYIESASLRKRFVLPVGGGAIHELTTDGVPIADFFSEPDPSLAAALSHIRREVSS